MLHIRTYSHSVRKEMKYPGYRHCLWHFVPTCRKPTIRNVLYVAIKRLQEFRGSPDVNNATVILLNRKVIEIIQFPSAQENKLMYNE